jgi:uncharacterized delta-60 repeat protein
VTLSATGPDQLMSAVAVPGGTGFYAAGFSAATPTGTKFLTVAKLTAAGALDTTWGGGDGIVVTTVAFVGGNDDIDVAVQPGGKIIVTGPVANGVAGDRDISITRLNADGTIDMPFGGSNTGTRVLDLSTGSSFSGNTANYDAVRGVAVDSTGRIYLHGFVRGETAGAPPTPRADTDFAVIRLTVDGELDTSYGGGDGTFVLDILNSMATARGAIFVQSDGKVIAGGYANSTATNSVQPVLYRVNTDGTALDTGFADQGLFHAVILAVQTEVYGFAVHANHLVTAGYGRASGDTNDWVSLRFALSNGARDTTWGGATSGAVLFDPSGAVPAVGDNCRSALALPDGRTVLLGSSNSGNPAQNAAFAVLSPTGQLDTLYGDGTHIYPLGADAQDQFWGGAVNGNNALIVGYSAYPTTVTQTDTVNDNSYSLIVTTP